MNSPKSKLNRERMLISGHPVEKYEQLEGLVPDVDFVDRFPISLAREQVVLGFASENGILLAICDENGWEQVDIVTRFLGKRVQPIFAEREELLRAINAAYQTRNSQTHTVIADLEEDPDVLKITNAEREDLLDQTGRPPVIRLVNSILFDAARQRASDIHIQPYEDKLQVRFRIDGALFDQFVIPKASQEEVLSRVKIIGKMNIAEKRLPQDGRASAEIGERQIDLRIASLPTSHGERIVIRLLDKSARLYSLDELGMSKNNLLQFQKLIRLEHGMILVTGPTGSGKSTTLYAALQELNTQVSNVVTLEDPIEYQLDGISQTQINEKKGMTFASGLRNILRQDPDIIMIGEIRDYETAEMAIQSALTGHLVFSTLHTNDAASAVTRLLDLGIEPFLVASSVIGVLSQRLVRRICQKCKPTDVERVGEKGEGCEDCRKTGFRGRVGVFELMTIEEEIRRQIQQRANAAEISDLARQGGMKTLREDGKRKVDAGFTTREEVLRISMQLDDLSS